MARNRSSTNSRIPAAPIDRLLTPVNQFLRIEAASGIVLVVATVLSLALANSPAAPGFFSFWQTPFRIGVGEWVLTKSLLLIINDALMAVFFFLVGLELKRELVAGELRSPRKAALPVAAAIGGMLLPAGLFLLFSQVLQLPTEARRAWAVPMATDIAFVVGVLALFGPRVPFTLKIMLLSIAIVDDLGAVLVIAVAFTDNIALGALLVAAAGIAFTIGLNRVGVRSISVYVLVGAIVWLAVLKSGVHPTIAGVILGLLTPHRAWVGGGPLREIVADLHGKLSRGTESPSADDVPAALHETGIAVRESISPVTRLEHALHGWVAFVIMPLFALANAGVALRPAAAADALTWAIAGALVIGKPLGVVGCSFLAVKLGIARLPDSVSWGHVTAGGCLAGIGFTMAIFLASLSLPAEQLDAGKMGIIAGSLISGLLGAAFLMRAGSPSAAGRGAAGPPG